MNLYWGAFIELFKDIWSDIQANPVFSIAFMLVFILIFIISKKVGSSFWGALFGAIGTIVVLWIARNISVVLMWVILGAATAISIGIAVYEHVE